MKTIFTIAFLAWAAWSIAQESEQNVKSKIDQVTVFLEGAQVTRHVNLSLKQGVSMLTLTGIAPNIQEQSIQVEGPPAVKILSVSFRVNYLDQIKKPEKIGALEVEHRKLQALLTQEKAVEEVYREEEAILKTNKSIGGTDKGVEIEELKIAMDYFRQRLMDIKQQLLQVDRNIRRYNEELGKIEAQLTELKAAKEQPTGEIIVKVSSKEASTAQFSIKYLVKEARWFPSYDIRARNVESPISITYKANVNQQSGEDWENVALTISSGNPAEGGTKPVIKPWILGFNNAVAGRYTQTIGTVEHSTLYGMTNNLIRGRVTGDDGEGLPGVNIIIKGTTVGTVSDAEGYYFMPLTADAQALVFSFIGFQTKELAVANRAEINAALLPDVTQLTEVVVTGYGLTEDGPTASSSWNRDSNTPRIKKTIVATPVVRQTNIEYNLNEPFSVKSDGEVRSTEMVEYELDALYEYYCAPKLDADAFLTAKILHWDEYNFLEGEASLFFEGKYIGKSILDTRNTTDTLTLSLGRDGNVLVKREKKKDYSSRQFVGSNQKIVFSYEISIRNKKAQPITIVIVDQIPVANDKDISVDKLEDSNADYDDESGLLQWKKAISAGKTELINLRYAVRYPKSNRIMLE